MQLPYKIQPWKHQVEAIRRARDVAHFALFFEQGAGKTSTCINILRHKYAAAGKLLRTLILCPPIVIENWRREFLAHSNISPNDLYPLTGSQWLRLSTMEMLLNQDRTGIVITNYESLMMKKLYAKFEAWQPEVMVLDESHKIKSLTSKRTKLAVKLGASTRYRYLLTGTPILNTPFDIWSQFLFLDGGEIFSADYRTFRATYFRDLNEKMPKHVYFPNWKPKPGALEAINKKIYTKAMRVTKAQCLDLPPLIRQIHEVEMGDEQRKAYDEMEKNFITKVEGQAVTGDLVIKQAIRLQQIATGFVKDDEGAIHKFDKCPRLDALEDLLESLTANHKVIVWAVFHENYADIQKVCAKLKIDCVEVSGRLSTAEKQAAVDAFTHNPGVRVLIGHPASAGIGVNLVAASYTIFYSRDFSLENDEQARARNHRGGSEIHDKITQIDLVARGTTDEVILTALADKKDVSEVILNHFRKQYVK